MSLTIRPSRSRFAAWLKTQVLARMPIVRRAVVTIAFLVGAGPALASGVSGLPTMLMGIPVLIVLNIALSICLMLRGIGARKALATVGALAAAASCTLFGQDAFGTLSNGQESILGGVFFGLAGFVFYLCFKLFSTPRAIAVGL